MVRVLQVMFDNINLLLIINGVYMIIISFNNGIIMCLTAVVAAQSNSDVEVEKI